MYSKLFFEIVFHGNQLVEPISIWKNVDRKPMMRKYQHIIKFKIYNLQNQIDKFWSI